MICAIISDTHANISFWATENQRENRNQNAGHLLSKFKCYRTQRTIFGSLGIFFGHIEKRKIIEEQGIFIIWGYS